MKFRRHAQIAQGPLDLVPALNVILLLPFFFLLTSSVMISPGTGVELPASSMVAISPGTTLVITVTRNNLIFFKDRRFTSADLPLLQRELTAAAKELSAKGLTLKADKQVPYELIVQIADLAKRAGLASVNFTTRPLPAPGP